MEDVQHESAEPTAGHPSEPWSRPERDRLAAALVAGVLGVGGLWLFSPYLLRAWARPVLFLSVLAAAMGPSIAALVLVAPRRSALRARHFVAGVVSAWVCIELAGAARRMGIAGDSGLFRAVWAPVTEELTKALLLGAMLTPSDCDRDREAIATAGVAVGAGFAFRENVVYFAVALDGNALPIEWLALRAIPPVFAHTLFGATYGTILAQAAIHARALELPSPRGSLVALVLATLAHALYNAVPWAIIAVAPSITEPLAIGWALVALLGTWALARRVRSVAREDPPHSERVSLSTPVVRTPIDTIAAVVAAVMLGLWLVPLALPRYIAVVFAPLALGTLAVLALGRALRVERSIVWLLLGIAARPFAAMGEAALTGVTFAMRGRVGATIASVGGALLWSIAAAILGARVGKTRGARTAVLAGAGLAAGMVAASIGGNLAAGIGFAPWREMLGTTLRFLPRTIALSMLVALVGATRGALRATALAVLVAVVSVLCDMAIARARLWVAVPLVALFVALAALVVRAGSRSER
ncbi:MAG: PrsW family intramembrane metalloprotease [Myxococcales bacterium]|nr:PrsW family intramembrane metalloprotease [Myxococcales bacterium]